MWEQSPGQEMAFTSSEEMEIREGFLCPICMKDLGAIAHLQYHYDEMHSNEDRAVLQSFKDLIDKAKRKLMTRNEGDESVSGIGETGGHSSDESVTGFLPGIDPSSWDAQELGATKSHTNFFKTIRSNRTDYYVLETNKLLIRLDKLITDSPSDLVKRKVHEQSIVEWLCDDYVPLCPDCGRRFTITRRKHHCRLCGGVMCAQCSDFITHTYARNLTSPVDGQSGSHLDGGQTDKLTRVAGTGRNRAASSASPIGFPSFSLPRSGSMSNINSATNSTGEAHIRLCVKCRKLLDRRDEAIEQHSTKPAVMQFYERLRACLAECNDLIPLYLKMTDSLLLGESNYSLLDAQDVRIKLIKLAETVDQLSKKILTLGTDEEVKPCARTLQLQRGIYLSANNYLKEKMLGLPSLPSEKELADIQAERKRQLQLRIAQEKMAAIELQNRAASSQQQQQQRESSPNPKKLLQTHRQRPTNIGGGLRTSSAAPSHDDGWAAMSVGGVVVNDDDSSDPLVQQMDIIRGYIDQARQAYKFDEVQILETNLKELQNEYWRQQDVGGEDVR